MAKYRRRAPLDVVELWVAVVRLPTVGTDVVLTLNRPLEVHDADGHATAPTAPYSDAQAAAVMDGLLQSFRIVDWSLFAS